MKKHREPTVFKPKALALAVAGCFCLGQALANPVGGQVVAGSASFATVGTTLTVTNSPGAIINWQGFSIGAGELTRFNQISAASSVLNRVITSNPSQLFGTLSSNGRVFLINPAGILVGTGAVIDTAGFVGSTLNLSNADFLANRLNFTETPGAGKVENYGSISTPTGGSVYLIGTQVENHGIINTPQGEVLLAAGKTAQLIDTATPGVRVEITADSEQALNLGQVLADSGRIGMVGALVRNSGKISASSVTSEGGRVFLKATQDAYVDKNASIEATGTQGGQVDVLGNRVALLDQARIDVSGTQGGGTIRVGGDYPGKNADVQNATISYVGKDVKLNADATEQGSGGKVIVWADDITRFYGDITAKGGAQSGNGGFVEVSGKRYLDFQGMVNTSAAQGLTGTLLLDPSNITIVESSDNMSGAGTDEDPFVGNAQNSALGVGALTGVLAETNVTVDASGGYGCEGSCPDGNITVAADIFWASTKQLTLKTGDSGGVAIYKPITAEAGALKLQAGSLGITQNSDGLITANTLEVISAGSVVLDEATNMVNTFAANLSGGSLAFKNGKSLEIGIAGDTSGIRTVGQSVNITVTGESKDLVLAEGINAGSGASANITLKATGNVSQVDSVGDISGNKLTVSAGTGIYLPGHNAVWHTCECEGGGYYTYTGNSVPTIELDSYSGDIFYQGDTNLTVKAASTNGSIALFSLWGALSVPGTISAGTGDVWLAAYDWIEQTVDSTTGSISGGLLRTDSYGGTRLAGDNRVTGFTATNYGGGNIRLNNTADTLTTQAITQAEGGNVRINNVGAITVADWIQTDTGNISLTATGTVTLGDLESSRIGLQAGSGGEYNGGKIKITAGAGSDIVLNNIDVYSGDFGYGSGKIKLAAGGNITLNSSAITTEGKAVLQAGSKLTVDGDSSISAYKITLAADRMDLAGRVDALTDGTVWLKPFTAGRAIDLGSFGDAQDSNFLELSQDELNHVSATGDGKLRIGDSTSGILNISAPITIAPAPSGEIIAFGEEEGGPPLISTNNLVLESGTGGVTQSPGATIEATNLLVRSQGSVTLNENNQVSDLLAARSAGDFRFTNAHDFTVGTVNGVSGIKAVDHQVDLRAPGYTITVYDPIKAGMGDITLTAGGIDYWAASSSGKTIFFQATDASKGITLTGGEGSSMLGNGQTRSITLETDKLTLSGGQAQVKNDPEHPDDVGIVIAPYSAERAIVIGEDVGAPNTLYITDTSMTTFNAPALVIGAEAGASPITVNASIDRSGSKLALLSGAAITQAEGSISALALGVSAGGSVSLDGPSNNNNVSYLSIRTTSGDINFANNGGALTLAALSGGVDDPVAINGVSTGSGNIRLSALGRIDLSYAPVVVTDMTGTVTLSSDMGDITDSTAGIKVFAYGLDASAYSGIGSLESPIKNLKTQVSRLKAVNSMANDVAIANWGALTTDDVTAISSPGQVFIVTHSPLTIGMAGVTAIGNVTLVAGGPPPGGATDNLTINGNVTSTSGSIAVVAGNSISISDSVTLYAPNGSIASMSGISPPEVGLPPDDQGQMINALKSETQLGSPPLGGLPPLHLGSGTTAGTQTFEGGVVGGEEPDTFGSQGSTGNGQSGRRGGKPGQCRV